MSTSSESMRVFASGMISVVRPLGLFCCTILFLVCLPWGSSYCWQEEYQFVTEWGTTGSDTGQIAGPRGMDMDENGYIYVCENGNKRIQKFDTLGNSLLVFGEYGTGPGQFQCPRDLAVDDSDYIYVSDPCNCRIQKFDSLGNFVLAWGDTGSAPGQFQWPQGIAIDTAGAIYVAETDNQRIQKFGSDGSFILQWGFSFFGNALGLESGRIYVYNIGAPWNMICFDLSGSFILEFGSWGFAPAQFRFCRDLAVDSLGNVYATDGWNDRVQKFDANGKFISLWGSSGGGQGQFADAYGIVVDKNGSVYVSDASRNRILKFRRIK